MNRGARRAMRYVVGTALLCAATGAHAQAGGGFAGEVERLSGRVKDLESRMSVVERAYVERPSLLGISSFDQKLGEGQIFFALAETTHDQKNYERAAIMLFDLVENAEFRERPTYDEAAFTLAEALFALKYRYAARTYYRVLASGKNTRFLERSIIRLIELAGELDNYEGLDDYYARYEQIARGGINPTVRYARGKLLLRRGRLAEGAEELAKVGPGTPWSMRALYLRGVALLKQKQTEDALALFTECAASLPVSPEDLEVRDLANMARGRLHYELGQLGESADAYQDIGTSSPHFSEMLYEVAWTFVKRGQSYENQPAAANAEFNKALQALELLLISNTSKRLESDVRILRGNLLTRLARHDEAELAFEDIVGEYSPTLKILDEQISRPENAEQVLAELRRKDSGGLTVQSVLPPVAQQWAAGDESVGEAIRVYADIDEAGVQANETRELADKLLRVIDAPNRMDMFPSLQEGRARALSMENSLLAVLGTAADLDARALGNAVQRPDAEAYRAARAARQDLQKKLLAMPSNEAEMAARLGRFKERLNQLDKKVFKQRLDIDHVQAQVAAIDATVRERKGAGRLAAAEEEYWRNELLQLQGALEQMRQNEKDLLAALRQEKESMTLSGAAGSQESVIRSQYREAVGREASMGKAIASSADPMLVQQMPEVERHRSRALQLLGRLDEFNNALRTQVDSQAAEIRGVVMLERARVDEYERMVGAYEGEAKEMASFLVRNALKGVRDQFYDVVLRADVGLIDLAWEAKQEKTNEVSTLVRKQKDDMKRLDAEFEEVLRDIE